MAKKHETQKPKNDEHKDDEPVLGHSVDHDEADKETKGHEPEPADQPTKGKDNNIFARSWQWVVAHKAISIPVAAVSLILLLAAIPFTRYAIGGLFIKQTFAVVVVDVETGKPISEATVSLNGATAETNSEGQASLKVPIGNADLTVSKKYYESTAHSVLVPIGKQKTPYKVDLKAQGRPVPVTVFNKISQKPAANITIAAEGTEATTDAEGKTILVIPADKAEVAATLSGEGFNSATVTLTVTSDEVAANQFTVTPSGKIYFLSNASGKIDLIKSDLDGANRQTVLAGTGKEEKTNTILLASPDWKYIALLSRRDGGDYPKLFLIETGSDKLTTMDEGEATFDVYGWSGNRFVYAVNRAKKQAWESAAHALKTYDASAKKITTLAETAAEGDQNNYAYEYFGDRSVYILGEEIVFAKTWSGSCYYCSTPKTTGKQATFNSVRNDGSQKKVIKSYPNSYIQLRTAEFGEIYLLFQEGNAYKVDEYHQGKLETIEQDQNDFYNETYPYYSVSPSSNKVLWSQFIDGKNTFFVGDGNGENGKNIGRSEDFTVYGWFTDDYILLTKKGSEMYILPAEGLKNGIDKALKISDYYKPDYFNRGFGYGYGG